MKYRLLSVRGLFIFLILFILVAVSLHFFIKSQASPQSTLVQKINAHWKKVLTPEQYHVLREGGTDVPFTHLDILNNHEKGTFVTADCGQPVFRSEDKFDSGTGWPSFTKPIDDGAVTLKEDDSLGMVR